MHRPKSSAPIAAPAAIVSATPREPDGETRQLAGAGVPALRPAPPTTPPAASGKPTSHRLRWWLGGAVLLLGGIGGAIYLWDSAPPRIEVETITAAPITRVLAVNGRIAARQSVDVRPLVSGQVLHILVAEGDQVTAGQVLAQIDPATQAAAQRQAVAALATAQLALDQSRETYARALALGESIPRTVKEAEARAVESAAQEVARMTALADQARILLQNHTLRAPMAGTIIALPAEMGQTVTPVSVLMTVADLTDLIVETDVDEGYALQIHPGQRAVLLLAGDTAPQPGAVDFVSGRVEATTGGLAIKIAFDAPVAAPIGLTVAVNIVVEELPRALSVPRTALVPTATGGQQVYVVETANIVRLRQIEVQDWPAARLIVTKGVQAGDIIATEAADLRDGQAVSVAQP